MNVSTSAWIITVVVMVAILAIDVLIIGRRPHEPSMKEAGTFIGVFVGLAVLFGLGVWALSGPRYAGSTREPHPAHADSNGPRARLFPAQPGRGSGPRPRGLFGSGASGSR